MNVACRRFPRPRRYQNQNQTVSEMDQRWIRGGEAWCRAERAGESSDQLRTFNPFNALFPREKKFSFANRSSWRCSAPAKLSATNTSCAEGQEGGFGGGKQEWATVSVDSPTLCVETKTANKAGRAAHRR